MIKSQLHEAALRIFAEKSLTQLSVKELADQAGVARGTIYNNFNSVEEIFEDIATQLTNELTEKITGELHDIENPAERLSMGVRLFLKHTAQEPLCGRFLLRFAATNPTLKSLLSHTPYQDLCNGIAQGIFDIPADKVDSAIAIISGGVLANIGMVLEGYKTWREAGSNLSSFLLAAFGVAKDDAAAIADRQIL